MSDLAKVLQFDPTRRPRRASLPVIAPEERRQIVPDADGFPPLEFCASCPQCFDCWESCI